MVPWRPEEQQYTMGYIGVYWYAAVYWGPFGVREPLLPYQGGTHLAAMGLLGSSPSIERTQNQGGSYWAP